MVSQKQITLMVPQRLCVFCIEEESGYFHARITQSVAITFAIRIHFEAREAVILVVVVLRDEDATKSTNESDRPQGTLGELVHCMEHIADSSDFKSNIQLKTKSTEQKFSDNRNKHG